MVPSEIVDDCGLTAIETRAAGVTVKVAELVTVPEVMVMVEEPAAKVLASPALPDVLLMVAAAALLELQCPVWVRSCVLASL